MHKDAKDTHTVTAPMVVNQSEELEEVQVLVAQHRRLVNWCPWREREREKVHISTAERMHTAESQIKCMIMQVVRYSITKSPIKTLFWLSKLHSNSNINIAKLQLVVSWM